MRDAHNIAWKLDLVLRGLAPAELLDSYQPEREPHVRFITEKAIELGRVQTLRDPEKARERDERMLAARRENRAPEKLRYPAARRRRPRRRDRRPARRRVLRPGPGRSAGRRGAVRRPRRRWAPASSPAATASRRSTQRRRAAGRGSAGGWRAWSTAPTSARGADESHARPRRHLRRLVRRPRLRGGAVRPDWYLFGAAAGGARLPSWSTRRLRALDGGRSNREDGAAIGDRESPRGPATAGDQVDRGRRTGAARAGARPRADVRCPRWPRAPSCTRPKRTAT